MFSLSYITNSFVNYISTSLPPGPPFVKMKQIINFQKGGTFFYVLFLMYYFNNFSLTSYLYLALHGTYGFLWLLKDRIFPDSSWERKITATSAVACVLFVLAPYWISPLLIIKDRVSISNFKLALCISLHTFGCVTMMASDTQKYFVLKEKKGLITNGWFSRIRNPNYLGEMMIYGTYALVGTSYIPYLILSVIWSVLFYPNMVMKDNRILEKEKGHDYIEQTSMINPF